MNLALASMPAMIWISTISSCSAAFHISMKCQSAMRSSATRCLSVSRRASANFLMSLRSDDGARRGSGTVRRGSFGSTILMLCLIASPAFAAGRGVSFRTEDGRTINALVFEPSQHPASAVVLVPMLGRPQDDWDTVGQRLADANILALAVDLPGVSGPGGSKILPPWGADVRASVSYLLTRPG